MEEECRHERIRVMADATYAYHAILEDGEYRRFAHDDDGPPIWRNNNALIICLNCEKQLDFEFINTRGIAVEGLPEFTDR